MIDRTARKRDAIGRFASPSGVEVDVDAVRADYEANVASVAEVAIKHAISASALQRLVVRHGWTPRAPHRANMSSTSAPSTKSWAGRIIPPRTGRAWKGIA